jgi:hypothetical protein
MRNLIGIGILCSVGCAGSSSSSSPRGTEQQSVAATYCSATRGPLSVSEAIDAGDAIPCPPAGSMTGQCIQTGGAGGSCPQFTADGGAVDCVVSGSWACVTQLAQPNDAGSADQ